MLRKPTSPFNPSCGNVRKPGGRADQKKIKEEDDLARVQGYQRVMESSELDCTKPSLQESYCEGPSL